MSAFVAARKASVSSNLRCSAAACSCNAWISMFLPSTARRTRTSIAYRSSTALVGGETRCSTWHAHCDRHGIRQPANKAGALRSDRSECSGYASIHACNSCTCLAVADSKATSMVSRALSAADAAALVCASSASNAARTRATSAECSSSLRSCCSCRSCPVCGSAHACTP